MMPNKSTRELLSNAVAAATPSCAGMFANVRQGAAQTRSDETKPIHPSGPATRPVGRMRDAAHHIERAAARPSPRAGLCGDVRKGAVTTRNDETNPSPASAPLRTRQVAAARLLALGRHGRAVAAEMGVNEHTITRWRRTPAFADEVRRQHELILAEQVRQRRAEKVDAFAAVADRVARKYGMVR